MQYLPNAKQMKTADQRTISQGQVSSLTLMERAAEACVRVMQEKDLDLSHTLLVCGSGNNGGDGLAIARILRKRGFSVTVLLAGNQEHLTEETQAQLARLSEVQIVPIYQWEEADYSLIVDALLGVGLSREVTGDYANLIACINACPCKKCAVDIPSGISADSGQVLGTAVQADLTVTMQEIKRGLLLYPGQEYAGEVFPVDIGIDTTWYEQDLSVAGLLTSYRDLLPVRKENSHKGTYGKLLMIAGSKGMSGAAYFNAYAAYTVGAGLVQIYTEESNREILQLLLPEAIITTYDCFDEAQLISLLKWADTVCVGSGLGMSETASRIMKTVIENVHVPCLVDADGLNQIAAHRDYFDQLKPGQYLFTPHMKEMSRLTEKSVAELQANRFQILENFVCQNKLTCILKDARTVVQTYGQRPYLNITGTAAMAKAGSGDVLSGIVAGLMAQKLSCQQAAILGTYLHGRCGEVAQGKKGCYSVLARDLIESLPEVLQEEGEKG